MNAPTLNPLPEKMKIRTDYFYIRRIISLLFVLLEVGTAFISWYSCRNSEMDRRILAKVMLGPFVLVGHDADALIMVESTMIPVVALWLWPIIMGIVVWLVLPRADRYNRIVLERQTAREAIRISFIVGSIAGTIVGGAAARMDPGFDRNATDHIFNAWPTLPASAAIGVFAMSLLLYAWKRNAFVRGDDRVIVIADIRAMGAAFVGFSTLLPGLIQGLPVGCTILVGILLGSGVPFVLLGLWLLIRAAVRWLIPPQYAKNS